MSKVLQKAFCIFFVLASFVAPAESTSTSVTDIESHYQTLSQWQMTFTQTTHVDALEQNMTKQGQIIAVRPNRLRIDYTTEPQKSYIYNGKTLWIHHPKTNEAQEFRDANQVLSSEALSFLSGLNKVTEFYSAIIDLNQPDGTFKITDSKLKVLSLLPKNPGGEILRLTLGIDATTRDIREAVLFNASGNVTHYSFSRSETPHSLTENSFALPSKAKVNVIK